MVLPEPQLLLGLCRQALLSFLPVHGLGQAYHRHWTIPHYHCPQYCPSSYCLRVLWGECECNAKWLKWTEGRTFWSRRLVWGSQVLHSDNWMARKRGLNGGEDSFSNSSLIPPWYRLADGFSYSHWLESLLHPAIISHARNILRLYKVKAKQGWCYLSLQFRVRPYGNMD